MPPSRSGSERRSDLTFLIGAAIGVIVGGLVIAAAILAITSRASAPGIKRPISFGLESAIHTSVRDGGPVNFAGPSGDTGFWVALEQGRLVALLVKQPKPQSCTLRWRGSKDTFTCDGRPVKTTELARYRSFTGRSGATKDLYMVALRDVQPAPGTTTSTSTTTAPATSPST